MFKLLMELIGSLKPIFNAIRLEEEFKRKRRKKHRLIFGDPQQDHL